MLPRSAQRGLICRTKRQVQGLFQELTEPGPPAHCRSSYPRCAGGAARRGPSAEPLSSPRLPRRLRPGPGGSDDQDRGRQRRGPRGVAVAGEPVAAAPGAPLRGRPGGREVAAVRGALLRCVSPAAPTRRPGGSTGPTSRARTPCLGHEGPLPSQRHPRPRPPPPVHSPPLLTQHRELTATKPRPQPLPTPGPACGGESPGSFGALPSLAQPTGTWHQPNVAGRSVGWTRLGVRARGGGQVGPGPYGHQAQRVGSPQCVGAGGTPAPSPPS